MTFQLAGLVSLTGGAPARSTFLIPFFKSAVSNWMFAQEIGADGKIVAFRRFDPFNYDTLPCTEAVQRNVGDMGVVAYYRPHASIVVEDWDVAVAELKKDPPRPNEPAVFDIDACYLTQDFDRLQ